MNNFSNAQLEGFVTHDPEIKTTKSGKSLCNFSLAINHYSPKDSEPRVSYIDVETWDKVADICSTSVEKGKRLFVMGSLRQERWENSEGKVRSRVKVVGTEVRFIESKPPVQLAQAQ